MPEKMDLYNYFMNNGKYFWKSLSKFHVEREDEISFRDKKETADLIRREKAYKVNKRFEEKEKEKENEWRLDEEHTGDG
jgi:hypothetical protein